MMKHLRQFMSAALVGLTAILPSFQGVAPQTAHVVSRYCWVKMNRIGRLAKQPTRKRKPRRFALPAPSFCLMGLVL